MDKASWIAEFLAALQCTCLSATELRLIAEKAWSHYRTEAPVEVAERVRSFMLGSE